MKNTTTTSLRKPFVWLEIDTNKILANLDELKKLSGNTKIMAVVKANAYGAGSAGIATIIQNKIDAFAVVGTNEAINLRRANIQKPIINLGMYSTDDAETLLAENISPTIFTYADLDDMQQKARALKICQPIWIKVDTGLNRLGVPYEKSARLVRYAQTLENLRVEGIYSTLTEDAVFDAIQVQRFLALKSTTKNAGGIIWSIASSQALFTNPEYNLDMVRIGISMLGYYPSQAAKKLGKIALQPTVTFKTKVACIKQLKKGESIYYKRAFIAQQDTQIATLLPGYSYGLDPRIVNGGYALIKGKRYPFVGGVTLTNSFVDIGEDTSIAPDDEVVIFGTQQDATIELPEVAALLEQNEYEMLGRIPEKVERLYTPLTNRF